MLVISRKNGQKIMINDNIIITVVDSRNGQCKIAIDADKDVKIYREEIYYQIKLANLIGKETNVNTVDSVSNLLKQSDIVLNKVEAKQQDDEITVEKNENSKKIVIKKNNTGEISFKGKFDDGMASVIAKIFNSKSYQKFSEKHKDSNFPMHIIALKDVFATGAFVHQAKNSKKIENERKAPLIYNSIISTGLSITSGYVLDNLLEKPCQKFIEKYKEINKNDINLDKQIRGFKIAKPVLIIGTIYYVIIPIISTFMADRVGNDKK